MKHTPEPWEITIDGQGMRHIVSGSECQDATTRARFTFLATINRNLPPYLYGPGDVERETGGREEAYANADRIVACVNACKGIEDPIAFMADLRTFVASIHP